MARNWRRRRIKPKGCATRRRNHRNYRKSCADKGTAKRQATLKRSRGLVKSACGKGPGRPKKGQACRAKSRR